MKKTFYLSVFFSASVLLAVTTSQAGLGSKFPIAVTSANLAIPTAPITVDGNTADWNGISPLVTDPQGDGSPSYAGDDIRALYAAKDANNLYVRMDLWDNANTNFGNGPFPNEGSYRFRISSNSVTYQDVDLGLAYTFCGQWSLGCNGSNGNAPLSLQGAGYVKVKGKVLELRVPLSAIGSPTIFTGIAAEANNCCGSNWTVLDTGSAVPGGREMAMSAAFDGTNYLAGIQGEAVAHYNVKAQLVSQTGALVGPGISTGRTGGAPFVAFGGNDYLMVWPDDATDPNMLYGQFISKTGDPLNTPFVINQTVGHVRGLSFGGGNYLVVYQGASDNRLYGRSISAAGTVGNELVVGTAGGPSSGLNSIAFDGTNFLVAWDTGTKIKGRFVSAAGRLKGFAFDIRTKQPGSSDAPVSIAFGGGNYLVVWHDNNDQCLDCFNGTFDLLGQLVTPAGSLVGGNINVSVVAGDQILPAIAFNGTDYFVTWADMRNDANHDLLCDAGEGTCWDIYGQYVSKTGALVGSEFPITKDGGNQFGGVSFGGGKALVLVNNIDTFDGNVGDVYGMFVTKEPNAPANLKATSLSAGSVKLTWADNSTDETGFRIYKKVGAGAWTLLAATNPDVTSYSDPDATGNVATKSYSYYVKACKNSDCSRTPVAVVPFRPISLAASSISPSRINLSWTDKSNNETGFQVYRKAGGCTSANTWRLIAAKRQNVTAHGNFGLTSKSTYSYKVRAYNRSSLEPYAFGYSRWSNCSPATTLVNDTVTIEGNVYVQGTSTPVMGAVVSTSLDSRAATTNASGHFSLLTNTPTDYCCTPYTITISAADYQTFSEDWIWGDSPTGQVFYLQP